MTDFPASHRDLLDAETATLATIGSDGYPQVSEVWFLHDDGELKTSLNDSRLKTKNLSARPQCNLLILDVSNPYRYLAVKGNARIEPDPDYEFADKLGAKYGGADLRAHDAPGQSRVVVTIEPVNVWPVDMRGG
jgi:PPOX class probable F420-dependent enzyme